MFKLLYLEIHLFGCIISTVIIFYKIIFLSKFKVFSRYYSRYFFFWRSKAVSFPHWLLMSKNLRLVCSILYTALYTAYTMCTVTENMFKNTIRELEYLLAIFRATKELHIEIFWCKWFNKKFITLFTIYPYKYPSNYNGLSIINISNQGSFCIFTVVTIWLF